MASLLERMNIPSTSSTGPIRHKNPQRGNASPYNRNQRTPKGDVDSAWSHDLYDPGSLSSRLSSTPSAPRVSLSTITQKALREATGAPAPRISSTSNPNPGVSGLSIKGASASPLANVVEVANLLPGSTPSDVAAIFATCGEITHSRLAPSSSSNEPPKIRLTYKSPAHAAAAVARFHNQPADGNVLSVRVVGASSAGTGLGVRLGGSDGLGLVRQEGSVDVLMDTDEGGSKMRSDSLLRTGADPRAQVLLAPPGTNPSDYTQGPANTRQGGQRRGRGGRGGGGGGRRGGRRGGLGARMDTD
ncbi:hypothetical protein DXG01_004939 [Tephrocybe rancida]|nr:hypothetical protein DXG01_004939 [Tephrocybe rancida]